MVRNDESGKPLGGSPASRGFLGRLAKVGWRWLEIIGIPVAIVASIGAYWQAQSTADALEDDRRAARFATAEQVLILGPTAPRDIQWDGREGGAGGIGGGFLEDVPNLVQNYARLPVSEMTIAVDLKYENGRTTTYKIPVGSLPPCRQVGISDGGNLEKSGLAKGVDNVVTYVYFVDPTGHKWKRYVGQEPAEVSTIPEVDLTRSSNMIVRTDLQRIDPCG